MKNFLAIFFPLFFSVNMSAQTEVVLRINHFLGTNEFGLDVVAHNDLGQAFKVSRCAYYISKFTVIHDGGLETDITTDTIALVDASLAPQTDIELGEVIFTTIEGVKFHIGVQVPENNADPSFWPTDHPLAHQTPSMHWGWTAGYRFMTFEGWSGVDFDREISLHGIGNDYYYTTTVMAGSSNEGGREIISISADYRKIISLINIELGVYSHGEEKSILALQNFNTKVFGTEVLEIEEAESEISWNVVSLVPGKISVYLDDEITFEKLILHDASGKIIGSLAQNNEQSYDLHVPCKGIFFISLLSSNGVVESKKVIVTN